MSETQAGQLSLSDYIGIFKRRRQIIAVAIVIGVFLGLLYVVFGPAGYSATSRIVVTPLTEDPFDLIDAGAARVFAGTEASVIKSRDVAELVRTQSGSDDSVDDLLAKVTVENPEDTLTLNITASADSADDAQKLAQLFAESFLQYQQETAQSRVQAQMSALDAGIEQIQAQVDATADQLAAVDANSAEATQLTLELQRFGSELNDQKARRAAFNSLDTTPGTIVSSATAPTNEAGLPSSISLLTAILLATSIGLFVAFIRDRVDPRLKEGELASIVGSAPVSTIQTGAAAPARKEQGAEWFGDWYGRAASRYTPGVAVTLDPGGAEAESYRRVTVRLRGDGGEPYRWILVTSAGQAPPEEVAANLAVTLGREGRSTLLIWSNVRRDNIAEYFALGRGPGLGEVLAGRIPLHEAAIEIPGCQGLHVLPVGSRDDAREQLFKLGDLKGQIDAADLNRYDTIVIIAPPPSQYADAMSMVPLVDAVLVAVDTNMGDRRELSDTMDSLRGVNANVAAVVAV